MSIAKKEQKTLILSLALQEHLHLSPMRNQSTNVNNALVAVSVTLELLQQLAQLVTIVLTEQHQTMLSLAPLVRTPQLQVSSLKVNASHLA